MNDIVLNASWLAGRMMIRLLPYFYVSLLSWTQCFEISDPVTEVEVSENVLSGYLVTTIEITGSTGTPVFDLNNKYFSIDPGSGDIRVKAGVSLDLDNLPGREISLSVKIQDDSKKMTHKITVKIIDVNEPPSFPDDGPWLNGIGVADGAGPETLVCSVEATDPDKYAPNNVLNYYISTPATPFTINDLGEITVATGQTTHHEKTVVWNIKVVATDAGVPQHTASTTVLIVVCPTGKPDSPKPCA